MLCHLRDGRGRLPLLRLTPTHLRRCTFCFAQSRMVPEKG
jgi:hypothetical protein